MLCEEIQANLMVDGYTESEARHIWEGAAAVARKENKEIIAVLNAMGVDTGYESV